MTHTSSTKITVTRDFNWQVPGTRSWVSFKAGWSGRVTRAQAEALRAAGAAIEQTAPKATRSRK